MIIIESTVSHFIQFNWSRSGTLQLKQFEKAECYDNLQSKHYETYTSVHLYETVPSRKISK